MRAVRIIGAGIAALGIAVTAAGPVVAQPTRHQNNVHLSRIRYEAHGRGLNGEWVKVTNGHGYPVSLRGWTLTERYSGHRYTFPDKWLAPGASVWLYSGRGRDHGANLYWNARTYVWHDNGDEAVLRNARYTQIDTCRWKYRGDGHVNCVN